MPSIQIHNQFEQSIHTWLRSKGFDTFQLTYHEHLLPHLVQTLQNRWSPTALYLRGRADRVAVHTKIPLEFEWEAKLHESKNRHDITLEALPLIHHMKKSQLGVKCLYIHNDPNERRISGFWVHELPEIRVVMIPGRWPIGGEMHRFFTETLRNHFPNYPIVPCTWVQGVGSGDPFVVIDKHVADRLPHWQTLVEDEIRAVLTRTSAS